MRTKRPKNPIRRRYNRSGTKTANELQALVAPIALYPDSLVAQVLSASTFPDQVAQVQEWLQNNKNLTGRRIDARRQQATVGPQFEGAFRIPFRVDNMAKYLAWTSSLGEAYHNQPKDVMAAIQTLRARAAAAGNLKSSSQITVVQQAPETIVIQPANPQVVYVPQYNPAVILRDDLCRTRLHGRRSRCQRLTLEPGIAIGAMMSGGCCNTWGWSTWNTSWHGGAVYTAVILIYGSTAWHGAYGAYGYHGYGAYQGASYHSAYGSAGAYRGYSANGTYHTGGAYSNAYGAGTQHTSYAANGAVHTGGSGYNAASGQSYHYGAGQTAAGGTAYHGTTSTGQHYAGGTTASGQHYGGSSSGGWAHDDGASARAASYRGHGSMAAGGFHGGGFRR